MKLFKKPLHGRARKAGVPLNDGDEEGQNVHLSFDTIPVYGANPVPLSQGNLYPAHEPDYLSFQPTVAIRSRSTTPEFVSGATIANRVGQKDYQKSQAIVLFSVSSMGLLIGFLISLVI